MSNYWQMPDGMEMGAVELSVSDLNRSVEFYRDVIGLNVLAQDESRVDFGLVKLVEKPGVKRADTGATGLYHVAILVPQRRDLAHFLRRVNRSPYREHGAADHLVSEAIYLYDPDGHGIEVYRDRPHQQWPMDGDKVRMTTDPLNISSLMAEIEGEEGEDRMPQFTRIGHVHLQVADLDKSLEFYTETLGLDLMQRMPGALFVSAAGYHHHFGLNTWRSRGASPAPEDTARLESVSVYLPSQEDVRGLRERFPEAAEVENGFAILDPSGIRLQFLMRAMV